MFKCRMYRVGLEVGVCLLLSGALASLKGQPLKMREGSVHAAWISQSACKGGTDPVSIRIEPNPAQRIQIGFFESSASAIGQQWRTAG